MTDVSEDIEIYRKLSTMSNKGVLKFVPLEGGHLMIPNSTSHTHIMVVREGRR